jgi:hypothetical protein
LKKKIIYCCSAAALCLFSGRLAAQFSDSLQLNTSALTTVAGQSGMPQWQVANQYGIFENQSFNGLLRAQALLPYDDSLKFSLSAGLDGVALVGADQSKLLLQQAFLKLKYDWLEFWAGRIEHTLGSPPADLSSGSLAMSPNARPFPMLQFRVDDYTPIPFTRGYAAFKGNIGHAWFEDDRYISRPYLHFKSLYLKFGGRLPVNLFVGLVHFALWGGTHPSSGEISSSPADYWRVIRGKGGLNSNLSSENANALGDHFGNGEYGLEIQLPAFSLKLYTQTPFEDGSGLEYLLSNRDRLLGAHLQKQGNGWFRELVYEYLHSRHQSGPGLPDPFDGLSRDDLGPNFGYAYSGRDDYYNNAVYRSGWTYLGRIVGTPLFMTEQEASRHLENVNKFAQDIVNNRVVAHHLAVKGGVKKFSYRAMFTYSNNYGTYAGLNGGQEGWLSQKPALFADYAYAFKTPLWQLYSVLEATYQSSDRVGFMASLGYDTGEMYETLGVMLGLQWRLTQPL